MKRNFRDLERFRDLENLRDLAVMIWWVRKKNYFMKLAQYKNLSVLMLRFNFVSFYVFFRIVQMLQ